MNILQIAKYYPPLGSARALQAIKVTAAIRLAGHDVTVIAGAVNSKIKNEGYDVIYIKYLDQYLNGLLPIKINKVVKEFIQLTYLNRWVRDSIKLSVKILTSKTTNMVFTQSTPFDCHLVGLYLKKKYGVKWTASFSDPYPISIAPYPYQYANKIPFIRAIQRYRLKMVLRYADKILVSSSESYELMCKFTNSIMDNKCCVIPHIGIDFDDSFNSLPGDGWLIHTGKLTKERSIRNLLLAIKECSQRNANFKGVKFIGQVNDAYKKEVHQLGLDKNVQFFDEIEQSLVKEAIKDCSGLLLVEANMEYSPFLPSKFADYATLFKPILAITPERSQVSYYLGKYGGGIVCGYDLDSITNGIIKLIDGEITGSARLGRYFSISNVSRKYSEIFHNSLEV